MCIEEFHRFSAHSEMLRYSSEQSRDFERREQEDIIDTFFCIEWKFMNVWWITASYWIDASAYFPSTQIISEKPHF